MLRRSPARSLDAASGERRRARLEPATAVGRDLRKAADLLQAQPRQRRERMGAGY
jgi:hypothetical protein